MSNWISTVIIRQRKKKSTRCSELDKRLLRRLTMFCGDIGTRRDFGHREDQGSLASRMDGNLWWQSNSLQIYPPPLLSNGLTDSDEGVIFPGWCWSKGKKEKEKVSCLECKSWSLGLERKQSTFVQLLLFLVNSIGDLHCLHMARCQKEVSSLAVRNAAKAQYLPVLQHCQWSGELGKVFSSGIWWLFSSDDISRIPNCQAPIAMTNSILWIWIWERFFNL